MNYKYFELEHFLQDEYFVRWVRQPNEESDRFWRGFLERYPEKQAVMTKARHVVAMLQYEKAYALTEAERQQMARAIGKPQQTAKTKKVIPLFSKMAASLTGLLVVFSLIWYYWQATDPAPVASQPELEWVTKQVGKGKKLSITLIDGTRVKLNAGSKCSFPQYYQAGKTREFKVHCGEVFFEVAEDSTAPFVVYTGETATKVLGTSFNIRHDKTTQKVEIALVTGKVAVTHAQDELHLIPGEQVKIYSDNIVKSKFDPLSVTGWKDGILVIGKLPFHDMVQELEKWYGVSFNIAPSVDTTGVYAGVFKSQSLENVLLGMGFTSELNFKINKNNVFLK